MLTTDFLERELFLPAGAMLTPSPDQREGLIKILQEIGEHFEKPAAKPKPPPWTDPPPDQEAEDTGPLTLALNGWAGTGKTTLMRVLVRYLLWNRIPIQILTPTGKAGDRIREVLRSDPFYKGDPDYRAVVDAISTIHRYLYGGPTEEAQCPECKEWSHLLVDPPDYGDHRTCPNPACKAHILLTSAMNLRMDWSPPPKDQPTKMAIIVDEGSMVSRKVHKDLRGKIPDASALLYVWDKGQLPPVLTEEEAQRHGIDPKDPWGPTSPEVRHIHSLTQVHRQASGSPIIQLATAIREGRLVDPPLGVRPSLRPDQRLTLTKFCGYEAPVDWLVRQRKAGIPATLICYTNRTRQILNGMVRDALGLSNTALLTGIPIVPRDLLLCRANTSFDLMNGTLLSVASTSWKRIATYGKIDVRGKLIDQEDARVVEVNIPGQPTLYVLPDSIGAAPIVFRDQRRNIQRTAKLVEEWLRRQTGQIPAFSTVDSYLDGFDAIHPDLVIPVDFGQALTAHASQGSQWAAIGIVWEAACWGMWRNDQETAIRWLYTALTRAAEQAAFFTLRKMT